MIVTLYSKPGCHLCEDVRTLLDDLQSEQGFDLEEIDITRDPDLFARYRYAIPVVMCDGREIARGRMTGRELIEGLGPRD